MNKFNKTGRKALSVFVSVATVTWLIGAPLAASAALTQSQIDNIIGLLQSFGADTATVNNVRTSLSGGTPTGGTGTGTGTVGSCGFTRDLSAPGAGGASSGEDVRCLQKYLNGAGHQIASTGAGSPGNETVNFGNLTKAAVMKWQAANGIAPAAGYFGLKSRAAYNAMSGGVTPPPSGTPPPAVPGGSGLSVFKTSSQPVNGLAPVNAARVPFTNVSFTASADGDVVVSSVTVQLNGPTDTDPFDGVVLVDENGVQLGDAKTFNSARQAVLTGSFTVKAGQTRWMSVAANMDETLSDDAGNVASIAVVGVNTSAVVNASYPIEGAVHTMNSSLTIGNVSMSRGSLDPGAAQTKEVGTTGYNFSSIKITAGTEDVRVKSIRWYQSESASSGDLANLKTVVDDVTYDAMLSSDGKYYVTTFPAGGIALSEGTAKDFTIRGDLVGGAARKVDFDIAKRSDIHVVEWISGAERYGIIPPFASSAATVDSSNFNNADDNYYEASVVTIDAGKMTVSNWTSGVPAGNIAENTLNQPIAGLSVDVKGEAVSVQQIKFDLDINESSGTSATIADLTNLTLVDDKGKVLAGPKDGSGTDDAGSITFTDTITFPIGITNVKLVGKLGTDFDTNDTVQASTTPGSTSYWVTVKGQNTNNTVTPTPNSAITGSLQTVKAGSLTVSVSSLPTARTIVPGNQVELSRYVFDAGQSGEDLRISTIPLFFNTSGTRTDVQNCQLYNGSTSANSNNKLNPTTSDTASSTSLTFDGTGLILAKGSVTTLSMKCDVRTGATGTLMWGIDDGQNTDYTGVTGKDSGQTITETFVDASGPHHTVSTGGSYTVTADSSVLYKAVQAGATEIPVGAWQVEASNVEDIRLVRMNFALGGTASNTPASLQNQKITLWETSAGQIGEAIFQSSGPFADYATSSSHVGNANGLNLTIPRGEFRTVTAKASFSAIDANAADTMIGGFIIVNYDGDSNGTSDGNYAVGAESGTNISGTSADQTTNGVRIFRSVPTITDVTPAGVKLVQDADLMQIRIAAGSGRAIGLRGLSFNVATVGATVTGFQVFGPSGALNSTAQNAGILGGNGDYLRITFDDTATDRIIPAGGYKIFSIRANSVTGLTSANTESISFTLRADSAYPGLEDLIAQVYDLEGSQSTGGSVSSVAASTTDNFIWTSFSTTTPPSVGTAAMNELADWTNGYGIPGFPSVGQNFQPRSFTD